MKARDLCAKIGRHKLTDQRLDEGSTLGRGINTWARDQQLGTRQNRSALPSLHGLNAKLLWFHSQKTSGGSVSPCPNSSLPSFPS